VLPYVLLSVPAGIVADRYDRRLVLLVTDVVRGAIMLVLAWLVATDGSLALIVAMAIVATCFSSFFGPAIGAYLPSLVRDERELGPANSAWATLDNLAFVIGPAVAGILITVADLTLAFVLNAISFAIVAAVLWRLPPSHPAAADGTVAATTDAPTTAEAALVIIVPPPTTVRTIARPLVGLAALDVVSGFVFGGLGVLTVILANGQLASGDEATGYLNAAIGVGGLIGAIGSGALVLRRDLGPALLLGAVVLAIGLTGLGASEALAVALVTMTVASAGSLITEVVSTTTFQRVVPDAVRGRAFGTIVTISTLAYAAGSLAIPVLADTFGALPVLAIGGAAVVGAAALAVFLVGPAMRRVPDETTETLRRVSTLPLFTGVPPAALEAATTRLRPVDVGAGTTIVREGEPADRFYLIERGAFAVDQLDAATGAERRLRVMGPDDVFGEIGLLAKGPRTATVTATTDGRLLALEGADFLELVSAGPGLASRLLDLRRGALVVATGAADGAEGTVSAG
jgi:MFS family permease